MDLTRWGLYLLTAAAVMAAAVLHYRYREPAGRGRLGLALLRGAALAILVLLLFDPVIRGGGPVEGGGTLVLLDASLSMRLPRADGTTRWQEAVEVARSLDPDRVVLFGGGGARAVADPASETPADPETQLAPALRSALESRAGRIVVLTDGGIEDAGESARLLEAASERVDVRVLDATPRGNIAIEEMEAPAWGRAGEEVAVRVALARVGEPVPDSVGVVLRRDGQVLVRQTVAVPAAGRSVGATLRFTPTGSSSDPVRLEAALETADAAAEDDRRYAYMRIAERPAGVALVSFQPDQEPRFLLPVLERALGVPVRGWLALPAGRYIRLGVGAEAGGVDAESEVRAAVAGADLRVFHGMGPESPDWARSAAARGRVLLFPAGPLEGLPLTTPPPQPGDWYIAPELPPSPVARLLAGAETGDVPPLMTLRPAPVPAGAWTPLEARLARRGAAEPVLLATRRGDGRLAVALGEGYWRWAFSGGSARDLYDALWSAMAAWLMEGSDQAGLADVRPVDRVVERGSSVEWRVPPRADSLRLVVVSTSSSGDPAQGDAGAAAAVDTTVTVADGAFRTPALPPGRYRYRGRAWSAAGAAAGAGSAGAAGGAGSPVTAGSPGAAPVDASAEGELTVEAYSPEFTRLAVSLEDAAAAGPGEAGAGDPVPASEGRPLRTLPWPYVMVVALLCVEWILRRRWGLR